MDHENEQETASEFASLNLADINNWEPIQLVAVRARIDSVLAAQENQLQAQLDAVKRARGHIKTKRAAAAERSPTGRKKRKDYGEQRGPKGVVKAAAEVVS